MQNSDAAHSVMDHNELGDFVVRGNSDLTPHLYLVGHFPAYCSVTDSNVGTRCDDCRGFTYAAEPLSYKDPAVAPDARFSTTLSIEIPGCSPILEMAMAFSK
jgi:hypothetical protein